jgi:outer membrane receptor protein involved in Fe transport
MSLKKYFAACAVSMSLGLGVPALHAQGIVTGSVSGTVQDPTGAVVPGAVITATNIALGQSFTATASQSGEFQLGSLPVGEYNLTISHAGFADTKVGHVVVETGKSTGLGVEKLSAGAVETVEVSTAQNLLETVQSQVTTTFAAEQIQNLPTGGGFDELALLVPGVVSTHGDNFSNTNGAGISSNGQRGRSNNFEIDGQSNNDNSVSGPQVFFSNPDAIQEIQIITNNFSAQYGRDAGSVINYVTKSGTNQFHGTASYLYEGSWLSSLRQQEKSGLFGFCAPGVAAGTNGCTVPHKPRFTDNTVAGTLGGPILRDRLFGFTSLLIGRNYNGVTQSNSGTLGGTTGFIPTASGLATLQSVYPNNPGVQSLVKFGPQAIPVGTFRYIGTPVTVAVNDGSGSPATQIQVQQYSRSINPHSTDKEILGRLDYQATKSDRFFLRYFYQLSPSYLASGTVTTGGIVDVLDNTHSVGADWSHTFGARVVNQIRYSFQQATLKFQGGGFPNCTITAVANCPASLGATTSSAFKLPTIAPGAGQAASVSLGSFGLSTSYPQGRVVKDTQIQDNLNINLGKHTIAVGGAFEFQNSPNVFLPNISGGFTLNGLNGLLQGTGSVGLAIGSPNVHFTEPDWSAYVNDDWKVTPSLTLNLGVRWEYFSQSINLLHNISVAQQTGPTPLWSTALPLSTTTFPSVANDYKHFEPRVGFAFNPSGMKSLVIRGGYAMNIAPAFYNIFLNSYGSAPVVLNNTITGCNNNAVGAVAAKPCLPTGGATYTSVHALDNAYLLNVPAGQNGLNPGNFSQTFVDKKFRQPVTQTYSLGIQEAVGRIGVLEARYVGAHTSGDFQSVNGNPKLSTVLASFPGYFGNITPCATSTLPAFPAVSSTNSDVGRVNCGSTNVRIRTNTAFEIYNGLQTSFNTRNYKGLTANLSYTWSRTVDNASEIFGTFGAGVTSAFSQNGLDTNIGERGVSGNSYPNVTTLGLTYVDPHFKGNHSLVGKVLGGFQLNTIYVFNSGQPYTPYQLLEGSFCDSGFNTAFNSSVDSCRPILSNKNAPLGSVGYNSGNGTYTDIGTGALVARSSEHWLLNTQAEAKALGTPFPGVSRNTLRGNSYNNLDASIFKNNKINERFNLQLQATFFNALNRAYYGAPDAAVEDAGSTFSNFNGGTSNNRNVQLGGRLIF